MAPEYTEINKLPGYAAAEAEYKVAVKDAGEDEASTLRAKLAWSEKTKGFQEELHSTNAQYRALEQAKSRLKEQYGDDVPESVYEAKGTPEDMERAAREFDEVVKARVGAMAPTLPAGGGSPGQPPTGVGGDQGPGVEWASRLGEIRGKILDGTATPKDHAELINIKANMQIFPAHERARSEAGRK